MEHRKHPSTIPENPAPGTHNHHVYVVITKENDPSEIKIDGKTPLELAQRILRSACIEWLGTIRKMTPAIADFIVGICDGYFYSHTCNITAIGTKDIPSVQVEIQSAEGTRTIYTPDSFPRTTK